VRKTMLNKQQSILFLVIDTGVTLGRLVS